jgi:hypothetical protein
VEAPVLSLPETGSFDWLFAAIDDTAEASRMLKREESGSSEGLLFNDRQAYATAKSFRYHSHSKKERKGNEREKHSASKT